MAEAGVAEENALQWMTKAAGDFKGAIFSLVIVGISMLLYWISLQPLNKEDEIGIAFETFDVPRKRPQT